MGNARMTVSQKLLIGISLVGGIASLGGTWLYLPARQETIEKIVSRDHEILIRLDTRLESIDKRVEKLESRLDRNGIVNNNNNYYEELHVSSTNDQRNGYGLRESSN